MRKLFVKLGSSMCGVVATFALMVTAMNVNSTCIWLTHQPKLPEGADKLRKC